MAHLLYGKRGIVAFYLCVIVYLYGDLAIYAVGECTECLFRTIEVMDNETNGINA